MAEFLRAALRVRTDRIAIEQTPKKKRKKEKPKTKQNTELKNWEREGSCRWKNKIIGEAIKNDGGVIVIISARAGKRATQSEFNSWKRCGPFVHNLV